MSRLTDLAAEMKAHLAAAKQIAAHAEADGDRDFTPSERQVVDEHMARAKALQPRLEQAKADEHTRSALRELDGGGGARSGWAQKAGRSAWSQDVADRLAKQAGAYGIKALVSGSIDIPSPLVADVVAYPARPTRVTDLLVERVNLTGPTFEYLRQIARTSNAGTVPDGAVKPTSVFTAEPVQDRARVFATLAEPIAERFFTDYPSLTRWLESELERAVFAAVEDQAINGDGVVDADTDNVTGILNTSGTVGVPFASDLVTTLRKARTALAVLDEEPSAWLFHPADLEAIDLLREDGASTGGFLVGGASPAVDNVFGGLPRVASTVIPVGTAILADWRQAVLAVRQDLTLDLDKSGENFKRNLVTARVEGRFGWGVLRPQSFAVIDLTAL